MTDGDRRKRVLAERIAKARVAPSFKLKTLDGKSVSLDDLKGKVAVVNFWGVWCGWCVREMPEFQKLAAKYAHDAHVRVLTIDNDQNPEQVRKFMRDKKYTFAVLLDDGFVGKNSITSFPTTWFLDKQGRIAFDKRGASDKLLEEFSWRVEALRQ